MSGNGGGPSILSGKRGIAVIIGLIIVAIVGAFVFPTGLTELSADEVTTVDQDESETVLLKPQLNATVDSVNGDDSVNVTLADTTTNNSVSTTNLAVGSNTSVTLETYDIVINNTANVDSDTATVRYEYPRDYGWGSGSSSMFGLLPLLMALAFLLLVIGYALDVI
jgi:hypothetical protein